MNSKPKISALLKLVGLLVIGLPTFAQVTTVTCSSDNMKRNFCAIPPHGSVQLARQRSDAVCARGSTWGVQGNQIWVDRGCRADFTVTVGRYPGGGSGGGYGASTVTCSSENMRRNFCAIPPHRDVRLARQRSDAACVRGSTWGVQGNQIWVDRGCRADFTIYR
ncbi:MAG TPA: DUF3011 domain-containing protein [Terriglobales bacterium]|nr:DUF3011 domain-containing protein [Terriglobales bacterium]